MMEPRNFHILGAAALASSATAAAAGDRTPRASRRSQHRRHSIDGVAHELKRSRSGAPALRPLHGTHSLLQTSSVALPTTNYIAAARYFAGQSFYGSR